jgi:Fur family transcriptional regulator, ferric uptake regulator
MNADDTRSRIRRDRSRGALLPGPSRASRRASSIARGELPGGGLAVEGKDLRKAGLKVTLPRLKILEILEGGATRHLSAEDIYRTLLESHEDIGLATVYRVLTQFEAAGLVTRHHFEDGMAVFELNQGMHHDHIVCLDCGRVEEFMDSGIEERQTAVAQRLGFSIRDHSLILYGNCGRNPCPYRRAPKGPPAT